MAAGSASPFGTLLRRYRRAAGLTQEELAERAGVGQRTIGDLERGVARSPRRDTVALLAEALALAPHERASLLAAGPRTSSSALDAPAEPPLVGRAPELALIERHLAGDGPPLLVLAGEPGIGKSRLLRITAARAVGVGYTVLEGGCQRRGGQEPYAPLLGALHGYIRGQNPSKLRQELAGCAWLVRLLPELSGGPIPPLPAWTLPPEQERRLMVQAVQRFLGQIAGPAGVLLALDDLQWADADALELLATLLHAAGEIPLRLVGAYRDTEVPAAHPLTTVLADLASADLAARRRLGPLAPAEAARLLEELLVGATAATSALRERVLERAGGVPFFVVSCAQALRAEMAEVGHGGGEAVPWGVEQSIRQRVMALPAGAQELLGVAAVIGRLVPRRLLAATLARSEDAALAAVEAACAAQLLREEGAETYQFAHDVIREVVEADLSAARRTLLHRRVAEALEAQSGEPAAAVLAYHYGRAGVPEKAVPYLELAGDRAEAQWAHVAAQGYYQELVTHLDALGRTREAARAREKLGDVLYMLVRYEEALAVLEQAAEAYRVAGDRDGLTRALSQIGGIHVPRGSADEGVARLEDGLRGLDTSVPSVDLGALYNTLGLLYFYNDGQYRESLAAAERVEAIARALDDEGLLVHALHGRALLLEMLGHLDLALPLREEEVRLAERAGALDILFWGLFDLAHHFIFRGDFVQSRAYFDRALPLAERRGDLASAMIALGLRAVLGCECGQWDAARRDAERSLALQREAELPILLWPLLALGRLCLAEGRWGEATRYLEEAISARTRSRYLPGLRLTQAALAECDLLAGHPERVPARLHPLLDRPGLQELHVTNLLPVLAWAHLEVGEVAVAAEVVAQAVRRAQAQHNRLALVDALRVQALAALRQERIEDAGQALEEGLALARAMPHPYAEARLLYVCAQMHCQAGLPGSAREPLEAALANFRRLGACRDAERAEQDLGALAQQRSSQPIATVVTDAQWAQIEVLLGPSRRGWGRPRADDRRTLEAILYVQRTGCAWAALPVALGNDATAHRRWQRWQAEGIWTSICQILGLPAASAGDAIGTSGHYPSRCY